MTQNNNNNQVLESLLNVLKADWTTKGSFIGKVKQTETIVVFAPDGTPIQTDVDFYISIESIRQILGIVKEKAQIPDDFCISIQPKSVG